MEQIQYKQLTPEYFSAVIDLGNRVHGDNYLNANSIRKLYQDSLSNEINASWVAISHEQVIGFRLTQAASTWQIDRWCSPSLWDIPEQQVCYFKCNTVDVNFRGHGLGSKLLKLSIEQVKKQGAKAGLAHIWLASPGNSAFRYFSKSGGVVVKEHPGKWQDLSVRDGYCCPVCPGVCECVAAEMLLKF